MLPHCLLHWSSLTNGKKCDWCLYDILDFVSLPALLHGVTAFTQPLIIEKTTLQIPLTDIFLTNTFMLSASEATSLTAPRDMASKVNPSMAMSSPPRVDGTGNPASCEAGPRTGKCTFYR
jgi:hypothetical protein